MKVKRLTLSNYRGFPQLDIEFGDKITVLAGINGSGKSAILRALASVLSHILQEVVPLKKQTEPLTAADIHSGKPALTISATFVDEQRIFHGQLTRANPDPTKAEDLAKRRDKARFAVRQTVQGSKEEKELQEQIRFLSELLEQGRDHFSFQIEEAKRKLHSAKNPKISSPIAVLYTTSRYLTQLPPRFARLKPFEPENAYAKALSVNPVSLAAFANWYRVVSHDMLGSRAVSRRMLRHLQNVVSSILPGFSRPRLSEAIPPKFYVKKDGEEFELNQLSDGERGLLALAFDLTRRLSIANPQLKDPIAESHAIVLVDEVELHLHPSWQRKVLARLANTFKNCQFVVTTHSPQVIGQSKPNCLRLLHRDADGRFKLHPVSQSFGMDSNWVLQEIMDTPARDYATEQKLVAVHDAVDAGHLRKARTFVKALESELGLFPELQDMKSLLDRFEMLKKKR